MTRESEHVAAERITLGRNLAWHRERGGLTHQELAERLYRDRTSIVKIEKGQQSAPRSFWCKADRVLKAAGELVTGFDKFDCYKGISHACDALATALKPIAQASHHVASTSALPEQVDAIFDLLDLSLALTVHSHRLLMGESADWVDITDRLDAATKFSRHHAIVDTSTGRDPIEVGHLVSETDAR